MTDLAPIGRHGHSGPGSSAKGVSDAILSSILSIAADAIITTDENQRIVNFNQGAEHIFGYSMAEAIGMPLELLLPERFRQTHERQVRQFAGSGTTARRMGQRREIFGLRRNGEEFAAEASISNLSVDGARLFTVVLRDVSDRRRLEENEHFLSAAGERLNRSLDSDATARTVVDLPVPFIADIAALDLIDRDDKLNRVVSTVPEALAGLVSRALLPGPSADSPAAVIDVLRTGRPLLLPEVTADWLEAHTLTRAELDDMLALRIRSLIIVPLVAGDAAMGTLWLARTGARRRFDGTDLQLAKELATRCGFALENARLYHEAQAATRARDEVLSVVSHDLRNPLSAITMCTRVLRQRDTDETVSAELLTTIQDSAAWMARLIQDLLDVSNIESGRLSIDRSDVLIIPMLERAVAMFERQASERQVRLHLDVSSLSPDFTAWIDGERVIQVIANLISNATRFTDAGGELKVSARHEREALEIAVQDTGVGIPREQLAHVFERGWRATRGTRRSGSGLGLAIARGIVEAHGGRIRAESTVGHGSRFLFTIPDER